MSYSYLFFGWAAVIGSLFLYQAVATIMDDVRYPPPGKLVDIGNCKLHLYTTGEQGPTVVLDAGLSGTSLGWRLVQAEVSKFTRVCSYDRAGYAWSSESSSKRTSENLVRELHTLLHKEKITGPYILVGHSFGGCNALLFAHHYPEETLGVILVDSVQEDMEYGETENPWKEWLLTAGGYKRFKGPSKRIQQMFKPLPDEISRMYVAQMNKTNYTKTVAREMEGLQESLSQLRQIHLRDKPLIVITAGDNQSTLQRKLLLKSDRSRQLIAEKSDHMINHHQPQIIVDAIEEIYLMGLGITGTKVDKSGFLNVSLN